MKGPNYKLGYRDKRLSIVNELEDTFEKVYRKYKSYKEGRYKEYTGGYIMGIFKAIRIIQYQEEYGKYYNPGKNKYRKRELRTNEEYVQWYNEYIKKIKKELKNYGDDDLPF